MDKPYKPLAEWKLYGQSVFWGVTLTWCAFNLIDGSDWMRLFAALGFFFIFAANEATHLGRRESDRAQEFIAQNTKSITITEADLWDALWTDRNWAERLHGPGAWDIADVIGVLKTVGKQ